MYMVYVYGMFCAFRGPARPVPRSGGPPGSGRGSRPRSGRRPPRRVPRLLPRGGEGRTGVASLPRGGASSLGAHFTSEAPSFRDSESDSERSPTYSSLLSHALASLELFLRASGPEAGEHVLPGVRLTLLWHGGGCQGNSALRSLSRHSLRAS